MSDAASRMDAGVGDGGGVVTRFAPSPSGDLHVGGARTALFCWAFARKHGGRFVVRLEDTDRSRSSSASAEAILRDLAWLGLSWDDGPELSVDGGTIGGDARGVGPFRQSERLALYDAAIDRLIAAGRAYQAFETPEELDAKRRAAVESKREYRYDRSALSLSAGERASRAASGEPHVVRFRMPEEPVTVRDAVLGDVTVGGGEADDFIIRKRDGFPTYHFAVVVDDELMGVTHVLRGQEHLNNTPRHVALQRAMTRDDGSAYRVPVYAHMPLIFNERGAKMSKRERDQAAREAVKSAGVSSSPAPGVLDDAAFAAWIGDKKAQLDPGALSAVAAAVGVSLPEVSVKDFRDAGYLPGVLVNFLGLLGFTPSRHEDGSEREMFDLSFLSADVELGRIGKSNARFDRVKLSSFNRDAIGAMSEEAFASGWSAWLSAHRPDVLERFAPGGAGFALLCRAARPRASTYSDALSPVEFALLEDSALSYDGKAMKKFVLKGAPSGLELVRGFAGLLGAVEPFEPASIESAASAYCADCGVKMGALAQPMRVAMTGTAVSPGLGETVALVGRSGALARVERLVRYASEQLGSGGVSGGGVGS